MNDALVKTKKKHTLRSNNKELLGVLWVLLNATTEYNGDAEKIVEVMNMIEKACPAARRMWRKSFEIKTGEKVIYSWRNGEILKAAKS